MKNMSEREKEIKAWKTFIRFLTVEDLLDSYVGSDSTHDYTVGPIYDEDAIDLETFGIYMTVIHGAVRYIFRAPLERRHRTVDVDMEVDAELLHMLDFEVVKDFIRILEL